MKVLKFFSVVALASGLGGQAIAEGGKFEAYGSVEGWNIFLDTEKKSCLIEAIDIAENVVQMGLTADRSVGYIGVFTRAETNIKKGEVKPIAVLLGENLYVGESMGMRGNITKGYSGGYILTDDPQMVEDVAQQYEMVVFPDEEYSFIVNLAGTKKAIEAARECNAKALES
jgi:hypothetical protein